MPKYLYPKDLSAYLLSKIKDLSEVNAVTVHDKLHRRMREDRLTKKLNGRQVFYTFKLDHEGNAHRAIFYKVKFNKELVYVLWDIAAFHRYEPALRTPPSDEVDEAMLQHRYTDSYKKIDSDAPDVDDSATYIAEDIYHIGQWFEPTVVQSHVLDNMTLPSILVGAPGSGKTLLAMGLLQARALAHVASGDESVLKLLYLVENERLAEQMTQSWQTFKQENFDISYHVEALFLTVERYIHLYCQGKGYRLATAEDRVGLLRDLTEDEQEELYHHAWRLWSDKRERKEYQSSLYQEAGARGSLFSNELRATHYPRLLAVLETIEREGVFIPGISLMPMDDDARPDLLMIDEAQGLSLTLLEQLFDAVKYHNVLYIGDSFQRGARRLLSLAGLESAWYQRKSHRRMATHQLACTIRLSPGVHHVANQIVLLFTRLNGGRADSLSYTSMEKHEIGAAAAAVVEPDICLLGPLSGQNESSLVLTDFGRHAGTAVVVFNDTERNMATKRFGTGTVLSAQTSRGLEFERVVLYLSEHTINLFSTIATLMKRQALAAETRLSVMENLSPEKEVRHSQALSLLSDLLIALSRSPKVYVYTEAPSSMHALEPFLPWFIRTLKQASIPGAVKIEKRESTKDEWLSMIHSLIDKRLYQQARENLIQQLHLSADDADAYIMSGEHQPSAAALQAFFDGRQQQPREEPAAAGDIPKRPPIPSFFQPRTPLATAAATTIIASRTGAATVEQQDVAAPVLDVNLPLSAALSQYTDSFYKATTIGNILNLFNHPNASKILFCPYVTDNQPCLFVRLIAHGETIAAHLRNGIHSKKLQKKTVIAVLDAGLQAAMHQNHDILLLCFLLTQKYWQEFVSPQLKTILEEQKLSIQDNLSNVLSKLPENIMITWLESIVNYPFWRARDLSKRYQNATGLISPNALELLSMHKGNGHILSLFNRARDKKTFLSALAHFDGNIVHTPLFHLFFFEPFIQQLKNEDYEVIIDSIEAEPRLLFEVAQSGSHKGAMLLQTISGALYSTATISSRCITRLAALILHKPTSLFTRIYDDGQTPLHNLCRRCNCGCAMSNHQLLKVLLHTYPPHFYELLSHELLSKQAPEKFRSFYSTPMGVPLTPLNILCHNGRAEEVRTILLANNNPPQENAPNKMAVINQLTTFIDNQANAKPTPGGRGI